MKSVLSLIIHAGGGLAKTFVCPQDTSQNVDFERVPLTIIQDIVKYQEFINTFLMKLLSGSIKQF
jgi:hypothetical protein